MIRWTPVLLLAAALSLGAVQEADLTVDRARVERMIRTLSSDEMEGRQAFTPGAERAASFIRGEFESAGLATFEGLGGYLQRIPVRSVAVEERRVVVGGREVPESRTAIRVSSESLHWTAEDVVDVVAVGAEDDPRKAFQALMGGGESTLVLVDPVHERAFQQLQRFLSGPSQSLEGDPARHFVAVLTSETGATTYEVDVRALVTVEELANVVGMIPGRRENELVIFSAHHDHIGIRAAVEGDSIANGADDDASGVTAVIELARHFKAGDVPERTLVFVAFAAEEMGGYGSRYFSRQVDPAQVVAMFNIEMIGKPASAGPGVAWITGFDRSDFGSILARAVEGTGHSFTADPYPAENLFFRSDNAVFARLGVPAHSISTTPLDSDPYYHTVSDEVETLDLDHMTATIRAIARAAVPIVSGEATPTRVDLSGLN